jgi:hypothetical protein
LPLTVKTEPTHSALIGGIEIALRSRSKTFPSIERRSVSLDNANDPCSIADKLPNGYHSVLAGVIVGAVMPDDYHMAVVAAVVVVMPIWLRKSAGGKEHKQDKY